MFRNYRRPNERVAKELSYTPRLGTTAVRSFLSSLEIQTPIAERRSEQWTKEKVWKMVVDEKIVPIPREEGQAMEVDVA